MLKLFCYFVQVLVCFVLLVSVSFQVQESCFDCIFESGVLCVVIIGDYKFFSYCMEEGGYVGFDVDMVQCLVESLGVKLVVVLISWLNLMCDFVDDCFDIVMSGILINLECQCQVYFLIFYLCDGKMLIIFCSEEVCFQILEQIDQLGVMVIVNFGGINEKFVWVNLKKVWILVYLDNVMIFQQIVDGKVDLMMIDVIEVCLQLCLYLEFCVVYLQ